MRLRDPLAGVKLIGRMRNLNLAYLIMILWQVPIGDLIENVPLLMIALGHALSLLYQLLEWRFKEFPFLPNPPYLFGISCWYFFNRDNNNRLPTYQLLSFEQSSFLSLLPSSVGFLLVFNIQKAAAIFQNKEQIEDYIIDGHQFIEILVEWVTQFFMSFGFFEESYFSLFQVLFHFFFSLFAIRSSSPMFKKVYTPKTLLLVIVIQSGFIITLVIFAKQWEDNYKYWLWLITDALICACQLARTLMALIFLLRSNQCKVQATNRANGDLEYPDSQQIRMENISLSLENSEQLESGQILQSQISTFNPSKQKILELSLDLYTMTYLKSHKEYQIFDYSKDLSYQNYFASCLCIFIFQISLIICVIQEIRKRRFHDAFEFSEEFFYVRFICLIILHVNVVKDIKQSMNMLRYFDDHRSKFIFRGGYLVSWMKLISSLSTEIACVMLLIDQTTIQECIINFFALGGIAQIDDICAILQKSKLKEIFQDNERLPKIEQKSKTKILTAPLQLIFKLIYTSVYFYFFPVVAFIYV
ncbi:hypothetical protein FGO68_gene2118 [Halteria grandinella]|uniref:Transmembrane protein n=1 Tax=Halteria grandinella TaxID=5974 RepID=A0A8J8T2Y9_HALGN|nr:hypothetical protein FGO68_gene2118 [Halteria grandinella]